MTNQLAKFSEKSRWRCLSLLFGLCMAGAPSLYAQEAAVDSVANVNAANAPADGATLNFVGADIEAVVKAVGHYTHTTFLIDPRVKGTLTLVAEKPLSKAQALQLLGSTLRLQGYAIVTGNGYSKVVPEADAKTQAGSFATTAGMLKGNQIATQIFRLNYEAAANLVTVLRPLISTNNTVTANPGNNTLVITDYVDNLQRLAKIIAALDSPAFGELDVVPIQYAIASDIAALVTRLLDTAPASSGAAAAGSGGEAARITVLADPRNNSVIIRAPSNARVNLAKSLIQKLDQPTTQLGNVHVVYLRNADALKLAQTLRAVVSADTAALSAAPTAPIGATTPSALSSSAASASSTSAPAAASTANAGLPSGGQAGFIQADQATNTLIITASEPVYRNLRSIIDQLDARRAQVYLESLIVEVSADKAAEFGIQWLGLSGDATSNYRVGGGTAFSAANNNILNLAIGQSSQAKLLPGNGLTLGVFRQINGQLNLGALAHALETDAQANILSIPTLVTLDNEEAKIIVGQNVPFITGQFTTPASGGSANVNPFQTIERKDVGLSLRVKPQISEGGTIKLAIYQETSSVQDAANAAGIITNKRSIESNVLVDDGQIIVLGGLIEDKLQDGQEKVRGLGDIPVIGNLFKYQTRKRTKTNLMVFLRPTVIRNTEQSGHLATDRYDYIRNAQIGAQPQRTAVLPTMPAPVLPLLQGGKLTTELLIKRAEDSKSTLQIDSPNRP